MQCLKGADAQDLMNGASTIYVACSGLGEAFSCSKCSSDSANHIIHETVAFQTREYQVWSHCLRLAMTELLPTSSCMLLGRYFSTHSCPPPEPAALCDADVPAACQCKVNLQAVAFNSHCMTISDSSTEGRQFASKAVQKGKALKLRCSRKPSHILEP